MLDAALFLHFQFMAQAAPVPPPQILFYNARKYAINDRELKFCAVIII